MTAGRAYSVFGDLSRLKQTIDIHNRAGMEHLGIRLCLRTIRFYPRIIGSRFRIVFLYTKTTIRGYLILRSHKLCTDALFRLTAKRTYYLNGIADFCPILKHIDCFAGIETVRLFVAGYFIDYPEINRSYEGCYAFGTNFLATLLAENLFRIFLSGVHASHLHHIALNYLHTQIDDIYIEGSYRNNIKHIVVIYRSKIISDVVPSDGFDKHSRL